MIIICQKQFIIRKKVVIAVPTNKGIYINDIPIDLLMQYYNQNNITESKK